MSLALKVVRLLRRLPRTTRFDRHLDNCAAYEIWYRDSDPTLPPLKVAQALGLVVLGGLNLPSPEPVSKRIKLTVVSDNSARSRMQGEPLDAA